MAKASAAAPGSSLCDAQQPLKADIDQLAEYFDERENGTGTELTPCSGNGPG